MKKIKILVTFFILMGLAFLTYPTFAHFISDYTSTKVIIDYDELVKNMQRIETAKRYAQDKFLTSKVEKQIKNINITNFSKLINKKNEKNQRKEDVLKRMKEKIKYQDGTLLGYIYIPSMDNISLPIYEGTKSNVLYHGVGRLKTSSQLMGGLSSHTVLTGHSGVSSATLFDNLDKVSLNDVLYIHFYDEVHEYKVDQIKVVMPGDADPYIQPEVNKDYVTLITCTPKAINSHRLLVRGHRVPYDKKDRQKDIKRQIKEHYDTSTAIIGIVCILIILLIIITIQILRKQRHRY